MRNVRRGYIVKIMRDENLGIIREEETMTEWLFFIDTLSKRQRTAIRHASSVTFIKDENYEQFVAINIEVVHSDLRMVV